MSGELLFEYFESSVDLGDDGCETLFGFDAFSVVELAIRDHGMSRLQAFVVLTQEMQIGIGLLLVGLLAEVFLLEHARLFLQLLIVVQQLMQILFKQDQRVHE